MAAPTYLRREDLTCQPGAVHTWHIAASLSGLAERQLLTQSSLYPAYQIQTFGSS